MGLGEPIRVVRSTLTGRQGCLGQLRRFHAFRADATAAAYQTIKPRAACDVTRLDGVMVRWCEVQGRWTAPWIASHNSYNWHHALWER